MAQFFNAAVGLLLLSSFCGADARWFSIQEDASSPITSSSIFSGMLHAVGNTFRTSLSSGAAGDDLSSADAGKQLLHFKNGKKKKGKKTKKGKKGKGKGGKAALASTQSGGYGGYGSALGYYGSTLSSGKYYGSTLSDGKYYGSTLSDGKYYSST